MNIGTILGTQFDLMRFNLLVFKIVHHQYTAPAGSQKTPNIRFRFKVQKASQIARLFCLVIRIDHIY